MNKDQIKAVVWGEKPFEVMGYVNLTMIDSHTGVTEEGEPVKVSSHIYEQTLVVSGHFVDGEFKGFKYFARSGGGYYLTKRSKMEGVKETREVEEKEQKNGPKVIKWYR